MNQVHSLEPERARPLSEGRSASAAELLTRLRARFPLEAREFTGCFESLNSTEPSSWVMVGRLLTLRCDVSAGAVIAQVHSSERTLSRQVVAIEDDARLVYPELFSALASALRMTRGARSEPAGPGEPEPRWFGGWRYLRKSSPIQKAAQFCLPKLALRIAGGNVEVCNWGGLDPRAIAEVLEAAVAPHVADGEVVSLIDDRSIPHEAEYLNAGREVLACVVRGECEKVVLCRKRTFAFSHQLDPLDIYHRVTQNRGHAFQYLFELDGEAWVGISPELLLHATGAEIATRPLAGSRRRGASVAGDRDELETLLGSEKDAREHDIAAQHMFGRLDAICERDSLRMTSAREVSKLSYIQHLASEMRGRLRRPFDAVDALSQLYPPPTILGLPAALAEQVLQRHEPFERGFYTGGIGVLSPSGDCELALAIRTACISGNELHVYAGSGYVAGSVPEDEWRETELKMQPFVAVAADLQAESLRAAGHARPSGVHRSAAFAAPPAAPAATARNP